MLAKLITVVIFATAVGAVLLGLRQQRLQIMHEMAAMHAQINRNRQTMWDLQVRIAERMQPEALQAAIARTDLELEPIVPVGPSSIPDLFGPGIPTLRPLVAPHYLPPLGMPDPASDHAELEGHDDGH